jgi:hypothetical protein
VRNGTSVAISGLARFVGSRHLATMLWNTIAYRSVRGVVSSLTLNRCSAAGVAAVDSEFSYSVNCCTIFLDVWDHGDLGFTRDGKLRFMPR